MKTAGLEDRSLVLVSVQLKQTLTLLEIGKKWENSDVLLQLKVLLILMCGLCDLYLLFGIQWISNFYHSAIAGFVQ